MSTTRMRLSALVTAGVLGLGLSACDGADDPAADTPTGAATPTAPAETVTGTAGAEDDAATGTAGAAEGEEIPIEEFLAMLQEPGEETLSRYSMTMVMEVDGQAMEADGAVDLSGDSPAMQMVMNMPDLGTVEMILVEGTAYLAMPGVTEEGTYMEAPPEVMGDAAALEEIDVSAQWDTWEESAEQVVFLGEEDVDGTPMRRYEVTVDAAAAMDAAGATAVPGDDAAGTAVPGDDAAGTTAAGETIVYDVWLDDDNLMRRMVMDIEGSTLEMTMDNWGEEQDITAPDPEQITDPAGDMGTGPTG